MGLLARWEQVFAQRELVPGAAKNFLWHDGHSWSLGPEIDGEQCCLYTDSLAQDPSEVAEGWKVWNGHDWADLYNIATRPGRIALSDTVRAPVLCTSFVSMRRAFHPGCLQARAEHLS